MNAYYLTPSQTANLSMPGLFYTPTVKGQVPAPLAMQQLATYQYHTTKQPRLDTSQYDGLGRLNFPNGDCYEGQFKQGKMEGNGVLVSARGDVYDGMFKNGFKHGKGTMKYRDGVSQYEGDWFYNKIEGKGVLIDEFGNRYEGEFRDNRKNGVGKCVY